MDLTTCRSIGQVEGPISWLAIREWAADHALEGEQRDDLFYHIYTLDATYLEHVSKKMKATIEEPKVKGKKRV